MQLRAHLLGKLAPQRVSAGKLCALLVKGDVEGHEFHGNQWQPGTGYITAFHGSEASFKQFDISHAGKRDDGFLGRGMYFSTDKRVADMYSKQYEVQLQLKNPLVVESKDFRTDKRDIIRSALGLPSSATGQEVTDAAKAKGHDSVVMDYSKSGYSHQEIAVFNHSAIAIKSVSAKKISTSAMIKQLIDNASHEAATSPMNLRPQPTEAQAKAGNYRKGHVKLAGLDISIENPAGSKRRPEWPTMQAHYGYIKRTEGADGDHVDVFLKPATDVAWNGDVYVIDQVIDGRFDEHKCMLGYDSEAQAIKAYRDHYPRDWQGVGSVTTLGIDAFKQWLSEGDTTMPMRKDAGSAGTASTTSAGWGQSSSATSGITAYGNTGKKKTPTTRLKRRLKQRKTS